MLILVYWATNRWGYQTFSNDFDAALYQWTLELASGKNVELWWFDSLYDRKWFRINLFHNDKHDGYVPPIG